MSKRITNEELTAISERAERATNIDGEKMSNEVFLAHARIDIPRLLAEIDRLRSEVVGELLTGQIESNVKVSQHGREYDLDEVWKPVRSVIEYLSMEYDEAVTIGGQFGVLVSEIERLRGEVDLYEDIFESKDEQLADMHEMIYGGELDD